MKVGYLDAVLLKDGRETAIAEVLSETSFLADVGDSPQTWDTIDITLDMIDRVIYHHS